jgi:hypothetical protein
VLFILNQDNNGLNALMSFNSVIGIQPVISIGEKIFTQQVITQKLRQTFKKVR